MKKKIHWCVYLNEGKIDKNIDDFDLNKYIY